MTVSHIGLTLVIFYKTCLDVVTQDKLGLKVLNMLAASSGKRNVLVWRPLFRPSVRPSICQPRFFLTLIGRAASRRIYST